MHLPNVTCVTYAVGCNKVGRVRDDHYDPAMLSDPRPGSTAGFPISGTMAVVNRDEFWKVVGLALIAAVAIGLLLSLLIGMLAGGIFSLTTRVSR